MKFYTVKEAAERIGKSEQVVRRLIREGYLEAKAPLGYERGKLVSEEAIERWLMSALPTR